MKKSEYKKIFEDNLLTDLQKYEKINYLQNKFSRFWTVFIASNAIFWPLLFITPNLEIDNSNLNPVASLKD